MKKHFLAILAAFILPAAAATVVYQDGLTQVFNPSATLAGINVGAVAGDPSSPVNGDLWYDSTAGELTARIAGANVSLGGFQPLDSDLTAIAALADPNADRILFWDDSAGTYAYLTAGTGLTITGTTITATGGSGVDEAANFTWTGTHDFTGATVSFGTFSTTALTATSLTIGATAITSTGAELNILDGVTSTAAEINALDGITSTVTELNYTDGVTSAIQTQLDAKAPLASPTLTGDPVAPTATAGDTDTSVATTAFVTEGKTQKLFIEKHAASHTLSAAECYGGVYYITGAGVTLTLPPAVDGMSITVICTTANVGIVDANASDLIILDGTALDDGDSIDSPGAAGDIVVLTYYDATGWYAASNAWVDGGAS